MLEYYLNGYIDETKRPKTEKMINIDSISSLIDFTFTPNESNKLKKAGIDFIINIISNEEDNNERFSKIKYDPLNDKIYSEYELNQEIVNKDKKLMERLVNTVPYYTKEHFDYYKKEYMENISKINMFYNMFGFYKNSLDMDSNINLINIENKENKENKKNKENKDNDIHKTYQEINTEEDNKSISSSIKNAPIPIEEKIELKKEQNINNNNANILIKKEEEIKNKIINFINDNIIQVLFDEKYENDTKFFYTKFPELNNDEEEKDKIKFEPDSKINEIKATQSSRKMIKDKFYLKYLIDNFDMVLSDLKFLNIYYEKHLGAFIYFIQKQKKNIYKRLNLIQKKYRDFLNQKTDKKTIIDLYCNKYNTFFTEYPGAFNSAQANEEFTYNINELNSSLWHLINIKETVSIKELQEIKNSNFIEFELKKLFKNIKEIFLIETEKFLLMINSIINLYQKRNDESTTTIVNMIKTNKEQEIEKENIKKDNRNKIIFNKEYILKDVIEITNTNLYDENENENELDIDIGNNDIKNKIIFYKKKNEPNSIDYLINKNTEIIFNNCIRLILAQEDKIENLIKSVKEWIISGNKKTKMKKKGTQSFSNSMTFGFLQNKDNENIIEENIRKIFQKEKNKYKYRICFLRSFVIKYIIIIIQTSIKIFENIDSWITKSVTLQSEAQNLVIQKLKNILKEKRLIDYNKDISTIELDSFEPVNNTNNNNNINNSEEIIITPRDDKTKIYEKMNIDYLINDNFINIQIKDDKEYLQNEDEIYKNFFDVKKFKIIIPGQIIEKKSDFNDILSLEEKDFNKLNKFIINFAEEDFYYDLNKFMDLYNKIKNLEIKKDIINETIFYNEFIKKYLFNKEVLHEENNTNNSILINKGEIKKIEKEKENKNDGRKKANINISINPNPNQNQIYKIHYPLICKALKSFHFKNIKKIFSIFKINITINQNQSQNQDPIEGKTSHEKIENDSNISLEKHINNINNNLQEHTDNDISNIEYENYLNNAEIFTFFALIGCKILTEKKEKELMARIKSRIIKDKYLSKNDFYNFHFWFESDFDYINYNKNAVKRISQSKNKTTIKKLERKNTTRPSLTNSMKFEKIINKLSEEITNISIKDFLFNIWKDDKGNNFNFRDFINTLKASRYINQLEEKDYEHQRYINIIFEK